MKKKLGIAVAVIIVGTPFVLLFALIYFLDHVRFVIPL